MALACRPSGAVAKLEYKLVHSESREKQEIWSAKAIHFYTEDPNYSFGSSLHPYFHVVFEIGEISLDPEMSPFQKYFPRLSWNFLAT